MKYIDNNKNKISKIGLGTGRFGSVVSEDCAYELLDFFYKNGGNVLDTARNYYEWMPDGHGKSEKCIGKWMSDRGNRRNVFIVTKGGVHNNEHLFTIDLSENALKADLKNSLDALNTDYIDCYLLHRDEKERPIEEIVETMQSLKELGNIEYIGVANWDYSRIKQANEYAKIHGLAEFTIIQTWWSLCEYKKEMWNDSNTTYMTSELYNYMLDNKYIGMAYTSQCKGYFQKYVNNPEKISDKLRERIETDNNIKKAEIIKDYCKSRNVSATGAVIGYITSNLLEGISLVGCNTIEQLKDIIDNADYELSYDMIKKIDSVK